MVDKKYKKILVETFNVYLRNILNEDTLNYSSVSRQDDIVIGKDIYYDGFLITHLCSYRNIIIFRHNGLIISDRNL